jgi:hypothetical protein
VGEVLWCFNLNLKKLERKMPCSKEEALIRLFYNSSSSFKLLFLFLFSSSTLLIKFLNFIGSYSLFQRLLLLLLHFSNLLFSFLTTFLLHYNIFILRQYKKSVANLKNRCLKLRERFFGRGKLRRCLSLSQRFLYQTATPS